MITRLTILLLVLLAAAPAYPQSALTYTPRVQVNVAAEEKTDLKSRIESYLKRELRQLPGVTVVETAPDWIIRVVGIQTNNKAKSVTGYALSYVVLAPFNNKFLPDVLEAQLSEAQNRLAEKYLASLHSVLDQQLLVGPLDELKQTCEELVAEFDTEHLEPMRQMYQRVGDAAQK
jgi:hypothetical protein